MMMGPTYNLLIVHTPGGEAATDWTSIQKKINARAPDIDVRVVINGEIDSTTEKWFRTRPGLFFCPYDPLKGSRPSHGKQYLCQNIDKIDQMRRLAEADVSVPRTIEMIGPLPLDPQVWGDFVVVKPVDGSDGVGVRVVRTRDFVEKYSSLRYVGRNLRGGPLKSERMIIQQYIDQLDDLGRPFDYRALMLFGQPLYLHCRRWSKKRRSVEEIAADMSNEIASNAHGIGVKRHREIANDEDVLNFAKRAAAVFPEIPVIALDILRDRGSRRLYVVEINPRGHWHLSSGYALRHFSKALRRATYKQFDALNTAASLLIEITRAEAKV